MSRTEARTRRTRAHRRRPVIESLEGRRLLSAGATNQAASSGEGLSPSGQMFRYQTTTGGVATIRIVGVGSLAGTTVDGSGALVLDYGGTNAYSKIVGQVHGGGGVAPLASIRNTQLINAGPPESLTGVGGTPLAAVLMSNYDLVAGGSIILTPGVTSLVLHSIGASTNIQLRTLPPAPSYRILPANAGNTAGGQSALFGVLPTTGSSSGSGTGSTGTGFGSSSGATTLEAGQTASITSAQGITLKYVSDGGRSQVLTSVTGTFTPQPNLLEPLAPGQALTEPPAPPGIIIKANSIGGPSGATTNQAVIGIQGDVQSIRAQSADGLSLNDTGNLATIKIQRVDNSTIIGQPISHIVVPHRHNAKFLTTARLAGNRNGATQMSNLPQIGSPSSGNGG